MKHIVKVAVAITLLIPSSSYALRIKECGVEKHVSGIGPVCPEIEAATSNCDPKSYNSRKSLSCRGSKKSKDYRKATSGSAACHPGDYMLRSSTQCNGWDRHGECVGWSNVAECVWAANVKSCPLEEFGVKEWKKCPHKNHGYEPCEHKSFGDIYFDCATYSRSDVETHINHVSGTVSLIANAMLSHKSVLAFRELSEKKTACIISKNEGSRFAKPTIDSMKSTYKVLFSREYSKGRYNCNTTDAIFEVPAPMSEDVCLETRTEDECRAIAGYHNSRKWLEEKQTTNTEMMNDIVAEVDSDVYDDLEAISNRDEFKLTGE